MKGIAMFEKATKEEMQMDGRKGPVARWPLQAMAVGDAVTIKRGDFGSANPQLYAHIYGSQSGRKYGTRKVAPETFRIWRIA